VSGLHTKPRPITIGLVAGVIAVCLWWLFEVDSSPLRDFYAQHLPLYFFWETASTPPRMAAHIVALFFTGNPHIRNETTYVVILFMQWFLLGALAWWGLQLSVRHLAPSSKEA
jgi:hypothetical protein